MILEIIVTVAVVIGILLFVGVPLVTILSLLVLILSGLLLLAVAFFVLFFLITDIILLRYRRTKGKFSRIDDSQRWERAVYAVNGEDYICVFPAESFARRRIYEKPGATVLIPRSGNRKSAYDRHSLFIIAVGNVFSAMLTAGVLFVLFRFDIL